MAFPTIESVASARNVSNSSSTYDVSLPSGVQVGDLVIVFSSITSNSFSSVVGYNTLHIGGSGTDRNVIMAYKVIESGDSTTTATVNRNSSGLVFHSDWSMRISGATVAEANFSINWSNDFISTINQNPPSLSPSWGSSDTLWIAGCTVSTANNSTTTELGATPSGYTSSLVNPSFPAVIQDNPAFLNYYKESTASVEDPTTYTFNFTPYTTRVYNGLSWTIAVATPPPPRIPVTSF